MALGGGIAVGCLSRVFIQGHTKGEGKEVLLIDSGASQPSRLSPRARAYTFALFKNMCIIARRVRKSHGFSVQIIVQLFMLIPVMTRHVYNANDL